MKSLLLEIRYMLMVMMHLPIPQQKEIPHNMTRSISLRGYPRYKWEPLKKTYVTYAVLLCLKSISLKKKSKVLFTFFK